jgi:hypothetical protein
MVKTDAAPKGWFSIQQNRPNSRGQLALYVSSGFDTSLFAISIEEDTAALVFYCQQCMKTTCRHRDSATADQNSTEDLQTLLQLDSRSTLQQKKKTLRITPILSSLLSTAKYPCIIPYLIIVKLEQDRALASHVIARRTNCQSWFHDMLLFTIDGADIISFLPETKECCSELMQATVLKNEVWILTPNGILPAKSSVWITYCRRCRRTAYFDGREYGIVNFENRIMVDIGIDDLV